jgi:hypothetical protein
MILKEVVVLYIEGESKSSLSTPDGEGGFTGAILPISQM